MPHPRPGMATSFRTDGGVGDGFIGTVDNHYLEPAAYAHPTQAIYGRIVVSFASSNLSEDTYLTISAALSRHWRQSALDAHRPWWPPWQDRHRVFCPLVDRLSPTSQTSSPDMHCMRSSSIWWLWPSATRDTVGREETGQPTGTPPPADLLPFLIGQHRGLAL
jgi:hypothetical protein